MAQSNPDPYNANTEEYISDNESSDQLSIGSKADHRDANIYVTREELEEWGQELKERIHEAKSTLDRILLRCEALQLQLLKDTRTLGLLDHLLVKELGDDSDMWSSLSQATMILAIHRSVGVRLRPPSPRHLLHSSTLRTLSDTDPDSVEETRTPRGLGRSKDPRTNSQLKGDTCQISGSISKCLGCLCHLLYLNFI